MMKVYARDRGRAPMHVFAYSSSQLELVKERELYLLTEFAARFVVEARDRDCKLPINIRVFVPAHSKLQVT